MDIEALGVHGQKHKVDKTEGASDQFPIWIFNFWPYGQPRAILKFFWTDYELLRAVFFMF